MFECQVCGKNFTPEVITNDEKCMKICGVCLKKEDKKEKVEKVEKEFDVPFPEEEKGTVLPSKIDNLGKKLEEQKREFQKINQENIVLKHKLDQEGKKFEMALKEKESLFDKLKKVTDKKATAQQNLKSALSRIEKVNEVLKMEKKANKIGQDKINKLSKDLKKLKSQARSRFTENDITKIVQQNSLLEQELKNQKKVVSTIMEDSKKNIENEKKACKEHISKMEAISKLEIQELDKKHITQVGMLKNDFEKKFLEMNQAIKDFRKVEETLTQKLHDSQKEIDQLTTLNKFLLARIKEGNKDSNNEPAVQYNI